MINNLFGTLSPSGSSNYRPPAPFLYEVAGRVKNCHFGDDYYDLNSVLLGLLFAQVIVDLRHLFLDGEHLACDYSRSFEFHGVDVFKG